MRPYPLLVLTRAIDPSVSIESILAWLLLLDPSDGPCASAPRLTRRPLVENGTSMCSRLWTIGRRRWLAAACTAMEIAVAAPAAGQTYQGAIRGLVRDGQGVVPGAEVTAINDDTGAVRTA